MSGDAKLHGVRALDPGKIVRQLVIAIVISTDRLRRHTEGEVGQAGVRNPLPLRILYHDAGGVGAGHKAERTQGDSLAGAGVE